MKLLDFQFSWKYFFYYFVAFYWNLLAFLPILKKLNNDPLTQFLVWLEDPDSNGSNYLGKLKTSCLFLHKICFKTSTNCLPLCKKVIRHYFLSQRGLCNCCTGFVCVEISCSIISCLSRTNRFLITISIIKGCWCYEESIIKV